MTYLHGHDHVVQEQDVSSKLPFVDDQLTFSEVVCFVFCKLLLSYFIDMYTLFFQQGLLVKFVLKIIYFSCN